MVAAYNTQTRGFLMAHPTRSFLRRAALGFVAAGFFGPTLAAQEPLWGGELVRKIDSLAEAVIAGGPVAAISIGVKRGGDLLLARGYGKADLENQVQATAETVYRIGSITKQFTGASVMQLVERGRIGLDDPLTKYLPDYQTQGHEITIRHLLTHTSGIKSYTGLEVWRPKMPLDLSDEELLALFKDEPFDFAPGERFLYNNSGYYLLGMIIERASGKSYREYLRTELFGPLGLTGSMYCDARPIIPNRAQGYQAEAGRLVNAPYLSMNQPGAAGALCSTVLDLLAWNVALRSGRVVSKASYEQMTTNGVLNDGSQTRYGFGLGVGTFEGHPRVAHGGGINGFNTMLAHFPDADLDIVVLSNTSGTHPDRVTDLIAKWALGIEVPAILDLQLAQAELRPYVGVYELRPGLRLTVSLQDGQLFLEATGQPAFRLRAQGDHMFVPTFDDAVRVVFAVAGTAATGLALHQGGQRREAARIEKPE